MSAEHGPALPVVYAPLAVQDLDAIWDWNEKTYGPAHAAGYLDFLARHIDDLRGTSKGGGSLCAVPRRGDALSGYCYNGLKRAKKNP